MINEAKQRVLAVWPKARCVKAMVTDDSGYEGWGYWIDGVPYRLRAKVGSEAAAWYEAERHIQKSPVEKLNSVINETERQFSQLPPWKQKEFKEATHE
jgi:hypothetical protein